MSYLEVWMHVTLGRGASTGYEPEIYTPRHVVV